MVQGYHHSSKHGARGSGKSAVAAAAYRSATAMLDERTGKTHDYTAKKGVVHSEIFMPAAANGWKPSRAELWNAAEKSHVRADSVVYREYEVALPHQLNEEERKALVVAYCKHLAETYGVAVDVSIHEPSKQGDQRNHHAHIMMTTKRVRGEGFGTKALELDPVSDQRLSKGRKSTATINRELWAKMGADALQRAGLEVESKRWRHGHLTKPEQLKIAQSIGDREWAEWAKKKATKHLGAKASAMERKGATSDRGDVNRRIEADNKSLGKIEAERLTVEDAVIALQAEREARADQRELRAAVRSASSDRILDAMTEQRATFTRRDLVHTLNRVVEDMPTSEKMATELLAHPDVIGLRETADAEVTRYTTRAVLAQEQSVLKSVRAMNGRGTVGLSERQRNAALRRHTQLDEQQRAAFEHMTSGRRFAIMNGEAGTGKSTTCAAIRDAYEGAGYRVIGMAWTNTVVQNMSADGFKEAMTLSTALGRLKWAEENGREPTGGAWNRKTVIMVDEAAMLSNDAKAKLVDAVEQYGAILRWTGDDHQLPSIERGGLYSALKAEHGAAELSNIYRVAGKEQKQAFNAMWRGEWRKALDIFDERGAIRWTETKEDARADLVAAWAKDTAAAPDKTRFVFAFTNADVDALNRDIRAIRRERGDLGEDHILETAHGKAAFAKGDRVQFTASAGTKEERAAGLINGAMGTITKIEGQRVTLEIDRKGKPLTVSFTAGRDGQPGQFDGFRHGYAGTIYKGQGKNLYESYLLHDKHWRGDSAYVALSRHIAETKLFVARETLAGAEHWMMKNGGYDALDARLKESAAKSYEAWREKNPAGAEQFGIARYVAYAQAQQAGRGRGDYDKEQLARHFARKDERRAASQFVRAERPAQALEWTTRPDLAGPVRQEAMTREARTAADKRRSMAPESQIVVERQPAQTSGRDKWAGLSLKAPASRPMEERGPRLREEREKGLDAADKFARAWAEVDRDPRDKAAQKAMVEAGKALDEIRPNGRRDLQAALSYGTHDLPHKLRNGIGEDRARALLDALDAEQALRNAPERQRTWNRHVEAVPYGWTNAQAAANELNRRSAEETDQRLAAKPLEAQRAEELERQRERERGRGR